MMEVKRYNTKACFPSRYGWEPDIIVLHNTATTNISSPHYTFINEKNRVSAHYLIGLDGEVRKYVDLDKGAWCNGTSRDMQKSSYYCKATNPIIRSRSDNANYYTISIECVGKTKEALTAEQINAVEWLILDINSELIKLYGHGVPIDRGHIIGHYEISPYSKATCGVNIQYDKIISDLLAVYDGQHRAAEEKYTSEHQTQPKMRDTAKPLRPPHAPDTPAAQNWTYDVIPKID